jgi:Sec-independent protein secretion pathway component TatC
MTNVPEDIYEGNPSSCPMVTILPPDLSATFIAALVVPLVIGFLVGIVIKSALKIGAAIALIVVLLIFGGILTPSQVIQPLVGLASSGPALTGKVTQIAGYLPYSSVLFIIGLAVGFFK